MTSRGREEGAHAAGGPARHTPVLFSQALKALDPRNGEHYIDATFGGGGYTRGILEAADCKVLAIDRDPDAVAAGAALVEQFAGRLILVQGRFGNLATIAAAQGFVPADGVVLDLGVSSMQLDEAGRGFSFMREGPLDMRMSREGPSAADVVAKLDEAELAEIIWRLGEERRSRAIARRIVEARAQAPIRTTAQLARLVAEVVGRRRGEEKHPATRTFQALRLFVNEELNELIAALGGAERILKPGGRLVVVSFHSLEDRIVKRFFSERSGRTARPSRHLPPAEAQVDPSFEVPHGQPIEPDRAEIERNPRARSARLRWGRRTEAAAIPIDPDKLAMPRLQVREIRTLA